MSTLTSQLPSEIWDKIFFKLSKFNIKFVASYSFISRYFKEMIENNRTLSDALSLVTQAVLTRDVDSQFYSACGSGNRRLVKILTTAFNLSSRKMKYKI